MSIIQYEHVRGNYNRTVEKIRKQQEEINKLEEYKKASILVITELAKRNDR